MLCPISGVRPVETKKVTVILYPDDDGGYTAVMPYFSCHLIAQGDCLTAQGWTPEEALDEARILVEGYLVRAGAEGRYHLEHARLDGLEVREMEVEAP
jgi:predicted RNase H-like HicB family nuclease